MPRRKKGEPLKRNTARFKNAKCFTVCQMLYGKLRDEIIEDLMNEWGYSEEMARTTYEAAEKRMAQKMSQVTKSAAEKHGKMLMAIAEEAYDKGKLETALKAIDLMNKTSKVYTETIKLENENIKISFDK